MPFKSEAQRRFMWAKHPEMAEEWESVTPKGRKLPEKIKHAFVVYRSMLAELEKIAYREAPWMTPAQRAHWRALQGGGETEVVGGSLPAGGVSVGGTTTYVPSKTWNPQLAPSNHPSSGAKVLGQMEARQAMTKQITEQVPLIGGMGEYYEEGLPTHLRGGTKVTPEVEAAAARASKARNAMLSRQVSQVSGPAYGRGGFERGSVLERGQIASRTPARIGPAPQSAASTTSENLRLQPPSRIRLVQGIGGEATALSHTGATGPTQLAVLPQGLTQPGTPMRGALTPPGTALQVAPTQAIRPATSVTRQTALSRPQPKFQAPLAGVLVPPGGARVGEDIKTTVGRVRRAAKPMPVTSTIKPAVGTLAKAAPKVGLLGRIGTAVKGLGGKMLRAAV